MTTFEEAMKDCFPAVVKTRPIMWATKVRKRRKPRKQPRRMSLLPRNLRRLRKRASSMAELNKNLAVRSHIGERKPRSQLVTPKPDPQNMAMVNIAPSARRTLFLSSNSSTDPSVVVRIQHTTRNAVVYKGEYDIISNVVISRTGSEV